MEKLVNLLFPPECAFCKKLGEIICKKCLNEVSEIFHVECIVCQKTIAFGAVHNSHPEVPIQNALSLFDYTNKIRDIIKAAKYGKKEFAQLRLLSNYGAKRLKDMGFFLDKRALLVPIPLHKKKLQSRGFNQAEIIAEAIAKEFGVKTSTKVLQRKKQTNPQYSQNREERKQNLEGAFAIRDRNTPTQTHIIIIDDIYTSGATLLEAIKAIRKAGMKNTVSFFTLAKGVLKLRIEEKSPNIDL